MMQEKHLSHLLESGGREAGQAATPPPTRQSLKGGRWGQGKRSGKSSGCKALMKAHDRGQSRE